MFAVFRVSWYGVCQRVKWQNCFGDKRGCPYGQLKCSKDESLVVRDDFWLSLTTGQPLLRTLFLDIYFAIVHCYHLEELCIDHNTESDVVVFKAIYLFITHEYLTLGGC